MVSLRGNFPIGWFYAVYIPAWIFGGEIKSTMLTSSLANRVFNTDVKVKRRNGYKTATTNYASTNTKFEQQLKAK